MKTLRNLAASFLLVFAAIGSNPAVVRAEEAPEPPGPDCYWSGSTQGLNGTWYGAYNCSWGCTYAYTYRGGSWSQTGTYCSDPLPD